jgi:hypothetical protein
MIIFNYIGFHYRNCGPTGAQKSALAADTAFGSQLRTSYGTDFGEAQSIFNDLHTSLDTIVAAGPSQEGMSPTEKAALNSQAINSAAASNKKVQSVIGEKAAMTGATPGVESGVTQAVRAKAATDIDTNLSNQEAGITEKSFDIGRENYNNAVKGEMALPGATMNPVTSSADAATGADKVVNDQANQNAAASNSWLGLVGGMADAAIGGLTAGCVTPDTLIKISDGEFVSASDLKVGDELFGIDGPERIIGIESSTQQAVRVSLKNGIKVEVSESHTFALPSGGYTNASESLRKTLRTIDGNFEVVSVAPAGFRPVLKISLNKAHAYVSNSIWSLE